MQSREYKLAESVAIYFELAFREDITDEIPFSSKIDYIAQHLYCQLINGNYGSACKLWRRLYWLPVADLQKENAELDALVRVGQCLNAGATAEALQICLTSDTLINHASHGQLCGDLIHSIRNMVMTRVATAYSRASLQQLSTQMRMSIEEVEAGY